MDATDEAYLLMPNTYLVRGKHESEFLWAPVIVIALVFVFVFFGLIFEVRRIVHLEQVIPIEIIENLELACCCSFTRFTLNTSNLLMGTSTAN